MNNAHSPLNLGHVYDRIRNIEASHMKPTTNNTSSLRTVLVLPPPLLLPGGVSTLLRTTCLHVLARTDRYHSQILRQARNH